MKAIVAKEFPGCADGQTQTRMIAVGETIEGDLAAVAVREGWAEEVKEPASPDIVLAELEKLSKAELEARAKDQSVDISKTKTKAEIIAALIA
ncbi:hypothetical protein BH10PSE7_BH10PSE7_15430 [soil metagenome]